MLRRGPALSHSWFERGIYATKDTKRYKRCIPRVLPSRGNAVGGVRVQHFCTRLHGPFTATVGGSCGCRIWPLGFQCSCGWDDAVPFAMGKSMQSVQFGFSPGAMEMRLHGTAEVPPTPSVVSRTVTVGSCSAPCIGSAMLMPGGGACRTAAAGQSWSLLTWASCQPLGLSAIRRPGRLHK